ncbi:MULTISPECIES: acyclic terpene utilization AtuA family protein [Tsukamurella]|uniref:DUF1446 domain-containing protein n=2 Tax=Tsukamurella TaxID=2060 RepID=A0A5C5RZ48_9ACTN|nr:MULTISPECIES: acyclic terpene utilization AtuA family protein [Tsukamurella]NMD56584.1 DUF1446 domain-containing protein [Tsukamurella columbiensis]TWS27485.1 DUF1446 domain-containing protein [Tsukamurella conjunctivitidis]
MDQRPVRIANFSGYLGDRATAIAEVIAGDPVDVLVGDYLAEITLAGLVAAHRADPSAGYVPAFVDQVRPHLGVLAERGLKVVTNAGGFNPAALAATLRGEARLAGAALTIAHVEGDAVFDRLEELAAAGHRLDNLDDGAPISSWRARPVAANAYLGGWGITAALASGADIVVCGRVTDASLITGPAAWWHGWGREDFDALAGAVVAGHIIECGPQAVGGNFSGFTALGDLRRPGFPIAEIAADGTAVITKHARDGGAVTVDTVTAQLVYEIQGPQYLNPDVTVDLQHVRLEQDAPDRVRVAGAAGAPPPATTKVAAFGVVGHRVVGTVFATGTDVPAKVELLRSQLELDRPEGVTVTVTQVGVPAEDPETQWEATVALRVLATAPAAETLAEYNLIRRLGSLYLQSFPGIFHDGASVLQGKPVPTVDYWPGLLPTAVLVHRAVLADGTGVEIAPPQRTLVPAQPVHPEPAEAPESVPTVSMPLGEVAHARSGDKGGNSNVGIWAPDAAAWPWLRRFLSTDEMRRLFPDAKDLDIVRHEFPEIRAVHFVFRGLLGTGGSSNDRIDQVGKAVGEYLRSRIVPVPESVLTTTDTETRR